jgi:hypothetical protein
VKRALSQLVVAPSERLNKTRPRKSSCLAQTLSRSSYATTFWSLLLLCVLAACPRTPKETNLPKDFSALHALLLEGEPRRAEAGKQIKDERDYAHVISLLSQFNTPGEAATLAWNAHHTLLSLGEAALTEIQKKTTNSAMERFTEERLRRRLGQITAPPSAFSEVFCNGASRGVVALRYETGREEAEGRVLFQVNGLGQASLLVKHTIKAPFYRSFTLSPIELGFLFDRVCASYFWEPFPTRESGASGEDAVTFSISVTPEGREATVEDMTVWGGEWRIGPTERLAKMLDATVARGKQTSLLLP